jgi:60kDa lysophospholipase
MTPEVRTHSRYTQPRQKRKLRRSVVIHSSFFFWQCALTKLSYLLSKPELSTEQVRSMVGAPLRGELTRAAHATPTPAIDANLEVIGGTLSHVVRLSSHARHQIPNIAISDAQDEPPDAGAPWAWTAAEAATTHVALLSWLVHLAAAANDVDALLHCLSPDGARGEDQSMIPGGIVNWINPASGRSPLHVAAINGSAQCVHALLKAGSLVHLRDSLGHTALYYVSGSILRRYHAREV